MVDLRINETRQTGAVRNRTYRVGLNVVRLELETAPTGPDKSGSKSRSESVYLFLEFTIICAVIHCQNKNFRRIGLLVTPPFLRACVVFAGRRLFRVCPLPRLRIRSHISLHVYGECAPIVAYVPVCSRCRRGLYRYLPLGR